MYCQNCGKEIKGKFCGYCGENNILIESKNIATEKQSHYNVSTANYAGMSPVTRAGATVRGEKKNNMPFLFLALREVFNLILVALTANIIDHIYGGSLDNVNYYEYVALSNLFSIVGSVLLLVFGALVIRQFKPFLLAVGCQFASQTLILGVAGVIKYFVFSSFVARPMFYALYHQTESYIVAILTAVIACVLYKIIQDNFTEKSYGAESASVTYAEQVNERSPRSRASAGLLCFFFGILGVHRFYVGKTGTGLLWLFTGGLFGIGSFIDFFIIIFGGFKDSDGKTV